MKFISIKSSASRDSILDAVKNSERVNSGVKFDEKRGRPIIKVKERGTQLYLTCEMVGGHTKDNGFVIGTFFLGSLKERDGVARLSGIIMTAPFYHLVLIGFCIYFLIQSFIVGGITLVPIILVIFSWFIFKDEFKKQGIIKRFLHRAVRYAENNEEK